MATAAVPASPTQLVLDSIKTLGEKVDGVTKDVADLKAKAAQPAPGLRPSQIFHATSGPVGKDSQPYSILKMAAHSKGYLAADKCKNELAISEKLKGWIGSEFFGAGGPGRHPGSFLVPISNSHMPRAETSEQEALLSEIKGCTKGWDSRQFDPQEAAELNQRFNGQWSKALGTVSDAAGGVLVGFPTLGELIDIQRNLEVFPLAGASEISLPPNGRIQYPKLTGGSTANWIGEAASITESTPATNYLDLVAKKLGIFVKLNNEILRFTSPTTEGLVRMDMARVAAIKADLSMLEGTGGTQIKGLITYPTQTAWAFGVDKLIAYTVTSNLFQPNDAADMEAVMPDEAGAPTAWLMRRNLWSKIRNRRADAVTAADGKGPFVFDLIRDASEKIPLQLEGVPVVRSSQISNTRGTSQTYVILGHFPDWLIGRIGIMEFLPNGLGDTAFQNDQTWLRGIQHIDAGPRHAASFVFADTISIA